MDKTILIVDNNREFRNSVAEFLVSEGFRVEAASDSLEGYSKFLSTSPSMAIIELFLPDLDGYELCHKFKDNRGSAGFPIIMICGIHRTGNPLAAFSNYSPDLFLVKPFSFKALMAGVNELLKGSAPAETKVSTARGRIGRLPFAKLLQMYRVEDFSGAVDLEQGKVKKRLFFLRGRPVYADYGSPEESLGDLLLRQGKIRMDDYMYCVEQAATSGMKQGEALIEKGAITADELNEAIRFQIREKILNVFGLDDAAYMISSEPVAMKAFFTFDDPVEKVIFSGLDRYYTLERLNAEFPVNGDEILNIPPGFSEKIGLFGFSPPELAFAKNLKSGGTVRQCIEAGKLNPFRSKLILYALSASETISITGSQPGGAPAEKP
jgi:CheY-like chemotaxis protein